MIRIFAIINLLFILDYDPSQTTLLVAALSEFNIGTLHGPGTHQWQKLRHAIDEWNGQHSLSVGYYLSLISPSEQSASVDIRFCDIAQRHLMAVVLPFNRDDSEFRVALSMCKRLRIPCLVDKLSNSFKGINPFVTNIGPPIELLSDAIGQLVLRMMWSSFLLIYKHPKELSELLSLFALWRSSTGTRVSFRAIQMPPEATTERYGLFLKHVRERMRHTNVILYTEDLGTIHSLLTQAAKMNMTESRHSYLVANMDLHLLEDFLGSEFHCNITGFQVVRHHPLIKFDLALAIDAVALVGASIQALRARNLEPQPQQLLCDAGDQWTDGMLVQEQLHKLPQSDSPLGSVVRFNATTGDRMDIAIRAITRIPNGTFVEIGEWDHTHRKWNSEGARDELDRWRFRIGPNGTLDLHGERLRVVVYLEEPFVMRKEPGPEPVSTVGPESPATQPRQAVHRAWLTGDEQRRIPSEVQDDEEEYEGFCIDLLKEMAKLLNFTYDIEVVDDGTYGVEDENGHWNGIIGVLQRHEADLSVSAVTITYSRVSVVDFTLPFMHLGIAILMRRHMADEGGPGGGGVSGSERGAGSSNLFTFMEPLSFSVWFALAVAYVSVAGTMWLLAKCSPYEWYDDITKRDVRRSRWRRDGSRRQLPKESRDNLGQPQPLDIVLPDIRRRGFLRRFMRKNQFSLLNSLWFAVGSLMQQGSDVIPRAAATRTVAVIWWLFTLILISSYTAQLAAFLTVERMSTPVESSADLAAQQRIKFGTLSNGSTMEFFRESQIPIYERMWSIMQSTAPTVFVNSSREGIARVKAGNYAYMMESTMLEYWIGEDCQLQTIGGLLDSKGYGIALPKGSPLRGIFSRAVLQLQERTILEALKNKWWKSQHRPHRADSPSNFGANPPVGGCPSSDEHSHSSLYRVFGIFYVLFAAILVALLLAIGEFCIESRRRQSLRLGLCLPGRIINWAFAWMEASSDNGGPATDEGRMASTKLRASELYLDKIAEIRATRTGLWPCSGGIDEDEEEEGEEEEDEDGVGTTKASPSSSSSSSSLPMARESATAPPGIAPQAHGTTHAEKGEDDGQDAEMDQFIASLKAHSPMQQQQMQNIPQSQLLSCSATGASTTTSRSPRRSPMLRHQQRRRQASMPEQGVPTTSSLDAGGISLIVPQRQQLRKASEPFPPTRSPLKRKTSIRDVFKFSTPSIVIGADPEDFQALHHLIPLTDERLLTRRQSSQPDPEDEPAK